MTISVFPYSIRPGMIDAAVQRYMAEHGVDPSDEQVRQAIADFMSQHPVEDGRDGKDGADGADGKDGQNVTEAQFSARMLQLWQANPPKDGTPGQPATQDQVDAAVRQQIDAIVGAWLQAHPVQPDISMRVGPTTTLAAGQPAKVENVGTAKDVVLAFSVPAGASGNPGIPGSPGTPGAPGDTRVKYAKTGLQSNATGVYTGALGGPGTFSSPPVVLVQAKGASARLVYSYTISGSAAAGYTVTVTFAQMRDSVTVAVLGLISLTVAITAPVTFDLVAMDQT